MIAPQKSSLQFFFLRRYLYARKVFVVGAIKQGVKDDYNHAIWMNLKYNTGRLNYERLKIYEKYRPIEIILYKII